MADNLQNQNDDKYAQMLPDYGDGGQYSELDYRVGFGRRLGAYLLDLLILIVLTGFLVMLNGNLDRIIASFQTITTNPQAYVEAIKSIIPASVILGIIYNTLEIFIGASLGKLILSIKIADKSRNHASYGKLTVRFIFKHIDLMFNLLMVITTIEILSTIGSLLWWVFFFGCFAVLGSQKRALHDYIAGTAVYYKEDII